jgi:hypothetical protein
VTYTDLTESSSDSAEELCVRSAFCPELQLGIVVGKISDSRNFAVMTLAVDF